MCTIKLSRTKVEITLGEGPKEQTNEGHALQGKKHLGWIELRAL